jgi:hypothetical protein
LRPGDIVVIEQPKSLATRLVTIDASTGAGTTLSDFGDPSQGPIAHSLGGGTALAIADTSAIYVAYRAFGSDARGALVHIDPSTGGRTVISDFGDVSQGPALVGVSFVDLAIERSGDLLVLCRGSGPLGVSDVLVRVNRLTGARAIVSDFTDPNQGPVIHDADIDLEESGQIVVSGTEVSDPEGPRYVVLRVDPTTGGRTKIRDLFPTGGGLHLSDLMIDFSGSILVVFGKDRSGEFEGGGLDRVDPVTGNHSRIFGPSRPEEAGFCNGTHPREAALAETGDLILIVERIQVGLPQVLAHLSTSGECTALTSAFMSDVAVVPTPLVNGMVSLVVAGATLEPPSEDAPAGVFRVTATLTNQTATPIRVPFFRVAELSGGNMLISGDRHPDQIRLGGRGTLQVPDVGGVLSPGESVTVEFEVGLQTRQTFTFFVNVYGEPDASIGGAL